MPPNRNHMLDGLRPGRQFAIPRQLSKEQLGQKTTLETDMQLEASHDSANEAERHRAICAKARRRRARCAYMPQRKKNLWRRFNAGCIQSSDWRFESNIV